MQTQLAQALAENAALKAIMAALPADLQRIFESVTRKPAVAPSTEVGISQIVPLMPPGKRSYQTIRRMIRDRRIPSRKEGHIYVFDPVAVQEALATTRQEQATAAWVANNDNRAIRRRRREEAARLKAMSRAQAA